MTEDAIEIAFKAVQLYAEAHPRPSSLTISQAAEMLGISRKTLSSRLKNGWVSVNSLGRIPTSEVDRLLSTTLNLHRNP